VPAKNSRLRLIVPGLLDPVPFLDAIPENELPDLPILSRFLARGQLNCPAQLNTSPLNYYECLANVLELPEASSSIASVSFLSHNIENIIEGDEKWLIKVDPCFMAPDRDQLVLVKQHDSDIQVEEAQQLAQEINDFYADYQQEAYWRLIAPTPYQWYIVSTRPISFQSVPTENVLGQSLKDFLIQGDDAAHWLNLFNEFQMILHKSEINKQRLKQKKHPVNSLWLWGAGSFTSSNKTNSESCQVFANNDFAAGIAKIKNYALTSGPEGYDNLDKSSVEQIVYCYDGLAQYYREGDAFRWVQTLAFLENDYFLKIEKALTSGNIKVFEIISPSGRRLLISKKLLRRWWRRKLHLRQFWRTK
jgi:hypothetical protein